MTRVNLIKKKIYLIHARADKGNFKGYMNFPALGIFALHAALEKNQKSDLEINSIDMNQKDIEIEEWGDYACFSITSYNVKESLRLIDRAKKDGSTVVVGGVHSTLVREKMLRNPSIDYVIYGEGDDSLPMLIRGESPENIPGLIYRQRNKIISNTFSEVSLDETFVKYDEMYRDGKFPVDEVFGKILSYYSQKGCLWRDKSGGCFFCSISDKKLRNKSPQKIWQEIVDLCAKYKPDLIRDNCDSFVSNRTWLRELADTKPKNKLPDWFSLVRAREVLEDDVVEDLEKIGFKCVYIGFESGDDNILKNLIKGTTAEMGIRAVEKLGDKNIKAMGTFVLGAPGENRVSLQKTLKFAEELHKKGNIFSVTANILIPYMGSMAFDLILKKLKENNEINLYKKYVDAMHIPLKELQETYLRLVCPDLARTVLEEFRDKINDLNKEKGCHLL